MPDPVVSVVIPCYKMERYLPAFLSSLHGFPTDDVEFIFIIDGIVDSSESILRGFEKSNQDMVVKICVQQNQGVAAARNKGIALSRGLWLTFPDPDDILESSYFSDVIHFLRTRDSESLAMLITRIVGFSNSTGRIIDDASDRWKFHGRGTEIIDISSNPEYFQLEVGNVFFKRALVVESSVQFDSRLHSGEDAKFIASYLLASPCHEIAFLKDTKYYYRKHAENQSLSTSWTYSDWAFDDRLRYGLLDTQSHANLTGKHPKWLEYRSLWTLAQLFKLPEQFYQKLSEQQLNILHSHISQILEFVDSSSILQFRNIPLSRRITASWLSLSNTDTDFPIAERKRFLPFIGYRMRVYLPNDCDDLTCVEIRSGSKRCIPRHIKFRQVRYLNRTFVNEFNFWVTCIGRPSVWFDSKPVKVLSGKAAREPSVFDYVAPYSSFGTSVTEALRLLKAYVLNDPRRLIRRFKWFRQLSRANGIK